MPQSARYLVTCCANDPLEDAYKATLAPFRVSAKLASSSNVGSPPAGSPEGVTSVGGARSRVRVSSQVRPAVDEGRSWVKDPPICRSSRRRMRLEKWASGLDSMSVADGLEAANLCAIWMVQRIGPSSEVGDEVRASAVTRSSDMMISCPGAGAKPMKRPTSIASPARATAII